MGLRGFGVEGFCAFRVAGFEEFLDIASWAVSSARLHGSGVDSKLTPAPDEPCIGSEMIPGAAAKPIL